MTMSWSPSPSPGVSNRIRSCAWGRPLSTAPWIREVTSQPKSDAVVASTHSKPPDTGDAFHKSEPNISNSTSWAVSWPRSSNGVPRTSMFEEESSARTTSHPLPSTKSGPPPLARSRSNVRNSWTPSPGGKPGFRSSPANIPPPCPWKPMGVCPSISASPLLVNRMDTGAETPSIVPLSAGALRG